MRRTPRVVSFSLAVLLASGAAHADTVPEPPRSVYRIEVSVTGLDENARAAPATYVVNLLENQAGTVASGANVPLGPLPVGSAGSGTLGVPGGASPRQDVGLTIHLAYSLRGSVVLVTGGVEISSADAPGPGTAATIHRVRVEGVTPVTPGTPAVFGSVYDLASHRRYEVTLTARRVL